MPLEAFSFSSNSHWSQDDLPRATVKCLSKIHKNQIQISSFCQVSFLQLMHREYNISCSNTRDESKLHFMSRDASLYMCFQLPFQSSEHDQLVLILCDFSDWRHILFLWKDWWYSYCFILMKFSLSGCSIC